MAGAPTRSRPLDACIPKRPCLCESLGSGLAEVLFGLRAVRVENETLLLWEWNPDQGGAPRHRVEVGLALSLLVW